MNILWKVLSLVLLVLLVVSSVFAVNSSRSLTTTKSELVSSETELKSVKQQLNAKTEELNTIKTECDDANVQLNTMKAQLDSALAQIKDKDSLVASLASANNELTSLSTQLVTANDEISQLLSSYSTLINQINVRFGENPDDRKSYITPGDTTITNLVQQLTHGFSEEGLERSYDYEKLYYWIVDNISYSADSYVPDLPSSLSGTFDWRQDYWRTPIETLSEKTGDSEDMALLLASMMINYNQGRFPVWLISMRSVSDNVKHMAVAYPVEGGNLVILDPMAGYYTGYRLSPPFYFESTALSTNAWLYHMSSQIPNAFIDMVFSEYVDQQFSSTSEFITWANQQ